MDFNLIDYETNILWVGADEVAAEVGRRIMHTAVVLDVGPGIRPQNHFEAKVHVCVEPFLPYIEFHQKKSDSDPRFVYLHCAWDFVMRRLPARSVDSVFAMDVIEHFEKEAGRKFLREAVRVARNQVVIFTPLGYYPQDYDENNVRDRWGMDGGLWQAHHSGWMPEDFGAGWKFVCVKEYHFEDQYNLPLDKPIGVIWAFYDVSSKLVSSQTMPLPIRLISMRLSLAKRVRGAWGRLKSRLFG